MPRHLPDGLEVRASSLQSVDLEFISQVKSYQKSLKNGIHSFPTSRSAKRDSVEKKPASLLVASLGKTLNGMSPSLCKTGRERAWRGKRPPKALINPLQEYEKEENCLCS